MLCFDYRSQFGIPSGWCTYRVHSFFLAIAAVATKNVRTVMIAQDPSSGIGRAVTVTATMFDVAEFVAESPGQTALN